MLNPRSLAFQYFAKKDNFITFGTKKGYQWRKHNVYRIGPNVHKLLEQSDS
jgi:hypothetical protein